MHEWVYTYVCVCVLVYLCVCVFVYVCVCVCVSGAEARGERVVFVSQASASALLERRNGITWLEQLTHASDMAQRACRRLGSVGGGGGGGGGGGC